MQALWQLANRLNRSSTFSGKSLHVPKAECDAICSGKDWKQREWCDNIISYSATIGASRKCIENSTKRSGNLTVYTVTAPFRGKCIPYFLFRASQGYKKMCASFLILSIAKGVPMVVFWRCMKLTLFLLPSWILESSSLCIWDVCEIFKEDF